MVFDAKRLIGRKFGDPIVQADIKLWPFKVASGSGGKDPIVQADIKLWPFKVASGSGDKPMIVVNAQGEEKKFHPEEISSMILLKKETAEAYFLEVPSGHRQP